MKNKILVLVILLLSALLTSCVSSNSKLEANFKKLKVGMNYTKVESIMGSPTYVDELSQNYTAYYWFENDYTKEDAENFRKEGVYIKYYCVIIFSKDFSSFYIKEKEDIFDGYWGKK